MTALSPEDLLFGATSEFRVEIPREILRPAGAAQEVQANEASGHVVLRPLKLADLQRIYRAAKDGEQLTAVLMVQQALVEPKVSIDQVQKMHAGLVSYLLREVNRISGLSLERGEIADAVQAPLARACFVLSRELGWTPEECANMTLGQVLLYLEMLGQPTQGVTG